MMACWKDTPLTNPVLSLPHALIRTPFWVPVNSAVFTVMLFTPSSLSERPKLPMLNPNSDQGHRENSIILLSKCGRGGVGDSPDSMTRPAGNPLDPHIGAAGPDGDAVVPGPDAAAGDGDAAGHLKVYAVRVGAGARRDDLQPPQRHVFGFVDANVK